MKKIILILVLIFGIMFGGNAYAIGIDTIPWDMKYPFLYNILEFISNYVGLFFLTTLIILILNIIYFIYIGELKENRKKIFYLLGFVLFFFLISVLNWIFYPLSISYV